MAACGERGKQALDELGGVDILVNNAGILRGRMVFNMTKEEWDLVIAVHLTGTFNTIKHAAVIMRQQRSGRIINTSSSSGLGNAGQVNYSAAQEGLVGITRTGARALGRYGVTSNAIRPTAAPPRRRQERPPPGQRRGRRLQRRHARQELQLRPRGSRGAHHKRRHTGTHP